jgi:hypothetical protein
MRKKANTATNPPGQVTAEPADRLEQLFEARVARALDRLGVPRAARIDELAALLERLTARLDALAAAGIALPADAANPASGNGIAPGTRAGMPRRPRRAGAASATAADSSAAAKPES